MLKDDYGMVTCPSCGNIVFVDMDGMVHVTKEEPVASQEASQDFSSALESPAEVFPIAETPADISPFDLAPMDISPMEPLQPIESAAPIVEVEVPTGPSNEEVDMNAFLGYAAEPGDVGANGGDVASQNDPNDPLGISAYANSEMSSAQNGPLVVTLIISGIDAKDLRDEIRQALQDSRFGWDAAALMAGIKGGVLKIDRVSPVKATIVINRIKNLSVRIRWEQSAITEIDPVEKEI